MGHSKYRSKFINEQSKTISNYQTAEMACKDIYNIKTSLVEEPFCYTFDHELVAGLHKSSANNDNEWYSVSWSNTKITKLAKMVKIKTN